VHPAVFGECAVLVLDIPWAGETFRTFDRLNLDIYEGDITAFLGHNSAGKTTTIMFMITGALEASYTYLFLCIQNRYMFSAPIHHHKHFKHYNEQFS